MLKFCNLKYDFLWNVNKQNIDKISKLLFMVHYIDAPYFGETRLTTPYFEEIILILNLPYYLIILLENLAPQFSLVWKLN